MDNLDLIESESESDSDSSTSSTSSIESEIKERERERKMEKTPLVPNCVSLLKRRGFPFSFWLMISFFGYSSEKLVDIIRETATQLLHIDDDFVIWMIQGNKENDRLRVICPDLIVDTVTALDLRSVIVSKLGYKDNTEIIPTTLFYYDTIPTIFLPRQKDIGTGRWESHQTYRDVISPSRMTEDIERDMVRMSLCNKEHLQKTEKYIQFLELRDKGDVEEQGKDIYEYEYDPCDDSKEIDNDTVFQVLNSTNSVSVISGDGISSEIKEKLGDKIDRCTNWFSKIHPDTKLNWVRNIRENLYMFDFTKSKAKCRLCNVSHLSNRQYVIYSDKSQLGFYHCYDNDANDRSIVIVTGEGVSAEIKEKLRDKIDRCTDWFQKIHPDSEMLWVREINDDLYRFDFTKSEEKCRLCNVSHVLNRQYVIYSDKSKKGFYRCHDNNAKNRSINFSLKQSRRGASIISIDDN